MSTTLILLSIGIFALAIAGMAVGVILSNRRLKPSSAPNEKESANTNSKSESHTH